MFDACPSPDAPSYIEHVLRVHHFLKTQSDLSPRNPAINETLSTFVRATMQPRSENEIAEIIDNEAIQKIQHPLRQLLGASEYEMECYCAEAMIKGGAYIDPRYSSYAQFIYRGNYEALVDSELKAMKWYVKRLPLKADKESVAFVGAGPLPISAIMFCLRTRLPITCVDNDEKACRLGSQLIRHLAASEPECAGIDKKIHYVHAAGEDHDYVTHPIVFIASLVERKDPVIMRIIRTTHTAATTIVRSAEGLSTLLYKAEDCVAGQEFYNMYFSGKSDPSSEAINTSLIYKLPPGKVFPKNKIAWELIDDLNSLRPPRRRMPRTDPVADL